MRVYAPRRLCRCGSSGSVCFGIPLDGDWVDFPDYFRQVTSGQSQNDVIHAKIVDPYGFKYLMWDQTTAYLNGKPDGFRCMQDYRVENATDSYGYFSIASYTTDYRYVGLAPSPNYKGKNKRTIYKEQYVKVLHPIAARMRVLTTGWTRIGPKQFGQLYIEGGQIYSLLEHAKATPDGSDVKRLNFNIKGTYHHDIAPGYTIYTVNGAGGSPLEEVAAWLTSLGPLEAGNNQKYISMALDKIYSCLNEHASTFVEFVRAYGSQIRSWDADTRLCTSDDFPDADLSSAFILNEPTIIGNKDDPSLLGHAGGLSNYWINYLNQHSLLKACESLPRLSDNSISNLIELVGFIKSVVVDHKIEIPKSLSSAWLAYRYQYNTTKLDINDAIKFVHRHMDLGTLDRMIVGRSAVSIDYLDTTVTCRCGVEVTPKNLTSLKKIWRALDQYGLTPDFYVIWDSIPYSFVVDWFLPISDLVSVWDANTMYFSGEFYTLENIVYSLKYTRKLGGYTVQCYTRWAGSVPSSLNSMYWLEPPSASNRTVAYRILDAGSLFIGR